MCGKYRFFLTPQVTESNAAELGRLLFKNCIQHVVHFTGTGRFSACASGAALVDILCAMREGRILPEELWPQLKGRVVDLDALSSNGGTINKILAAHWGALAWEQIARLQHLRVQLEAKRAKRTVFYSQAIDLPAGPGTFSPEDAKSALKVVNMTKTNYLMGMCPLFIGMEVRLSCVVQEPLLTREVPGIIRRIALHPKEVIPPDIGASAVHILKYQPLGVLVEVDDPEYGKYTSGDGDTPSKHFWIEPIVPKQPWQFMIAPKQSISLKRRQLPLAPRSVLGHFGLQGITARNGILTVLTKPPNTTESDYALALYVLLSRATKLQDVYIVDLPERHWFERKLTETNPCLVERMRFFQRRSDASKLEGQRFLEKLNWNRNSYVKLTCELRAQPT